MINPEIHIAKATAFGNNCGFNCLVHVLIEGLMAKNQNQLKKLFDEDPSYQALLLAFKEYYGVPNITFNSFMDLFKKYTNPIDHEAILSPVLRVYLIKIISDPDSDFYYGMPQKTKNSWLDKAKRLKIHKGELIDDQDLVVMGNAFGIKVGIRAEKISPQVPWPEPVFLNEGGQTKQIIFHNKGAHWEYEVDSDLIAEVHNAPYQAEEALKKYNKENEEEELKFFSNLQGQPEEDAGVMLESFRSSKEQALDSLLKEKSQGAQFYYILKPAEASVDQIQERIKQAVKSSMLNKPVELKKLAEDKVQHEPVKMPGAQQPKASKPQTLTSQAPKPKPPATTQSVRLQETPLGIKTPPPIPKKPDMTPQLRANFQREREDRERKEKEHAEKAKKDKPNSVKPKTPKSKG